MRFKAILAEAARKRYPLSILLMVVGVLAIPFTYLFVHFGLELTSLWWTVLSIGLGVVIGCAMIGLGSLVEDIHDISMHTVGYDLEVGEVPEDMIDHNAQAEAAEADTPDAVPAEEQAKSATGEQIEG